jgi:hypothetical protein
MTAKEELDKLRADRAAAKKVGVLTHMGADMFHNPHVVTVDWHLDVALAWAAADTHVGFVLFCRHVLLICLGCSPHPMMVPRMVPAVACRVWGSGSRVGFWIHDHLNPVCCLWLLCCRPLRRAKASLRRSLPPALLGR